MSGSEGGTTILETPPYVIALVFFFFLVITLGFEKVCLGNCSCNPDTSLTSNLTLLTAALCGACSCCNGCGERCRSAGSRACSVP